MTAVVMSTSSPLSRWAVVMHDGRTVVVEGREIAVERAGWLTIYTGAVADEVPVVAAQFRLSAVTAWAVAA